MDIKTFWETTKKELSNIPINASIKENPEKSNREYTTYDIELTSFNNDLIAGWYSVPNHVGNQKLPGILAVPGYGGIKEIPTILPSTGFVVLTLFPRAQGLSEKYWKLETTTKLTHHIDDKSKYYYRGAYMDCIRGIDFLSEQSDVDANKIGMWSRSQGGGFTLAAASLDDRIKAAVAEEPFLCHYELSKTLDSRPYVELKEYFENNPSQEAKSMETLKYFDPINLVQWITCPTLVNAGSKDPVCPLETIQPVFNNIPTIKSLLVYPELPHSPCADFNKQALNWLNTHLT